MFQYPILFAIACVTFQGYVTFLPFQFGSEFEAAKSGCFENFGDCREFVDQRHREQQQLLTGHPLWYSLTRRTVLEVHIILSTSFFFVLVMLDGSSSILMPLHFWWQKFRWQIAASAHSCSWMTWIQIAEVYYSKKPGQPGRMIAWVCLCVILLHTDCSSFSSYQFPHHIRGLW